MKLPNNPGDVKIFTLGAGFLFVCVFVCLFYLIGQCFLYMDTLWPKKQSISYYLNTVSRELANYLCQFTSLNKVVKIKDLIQILFKGERCFPSTLQILIITLRTFLLCNCMGLFTGTSVSLRHKLNVHLSNKTLKIMTIFVCESLLRNIVVQIAQL